MTKWIAILVLVPALLLAVQACGGDSNGAAGQTANEERPTATATMNAPAEATPTPEAQTQQSEPSAPAEATPTPTPARTSAPSGDRLSVQEYLDLCASEPVLEFEGVVESATYGEMVGINDSIVEHYAVHPPEELSEWNDRILEDGRSLREYYSRFPADEPVPPEDDEFTNLLTSLDAALDEALEAISDPSLREKIKYGCHPVHRYDEDAPPPSSDESEAPEGEEQEGAQLTTQGYAEALEEAISSRDDELEKAAEEFLGGTLFSIDVLERVGSLEAAESWSEEDAAFASEFAETLVRATADFFGFALEFARDALDEVSGLEPPEHLAGLHEDFTRAYEETVRFTPELVDFLKDADTRIRNREDLAEFYTFINAAGASSLDPDLEAKGEELAEQADQACQALKDQLEAELERDIDISCEFE